MRNSPACMRSRSSESKRMTTVDQTPAGMVAYAKGAPEVILDACTAQLTDHGIMPLHAAGREQMLDVARDMARQALRVLGIAYKPHATVEDAERDMTLLGLVEMIDPHDQKEGRHSHVRTSGDQSSDDHRRPSADGRGRGP